jgi:hypothetical protein
LSQHSKLTVKEFKITPNKRVVKTNYSITLNDAVHGYSIDLTIETFVVITKMWTYFTVRIPQDENDKSFQREFIKTVYDIEKADKNNFLISMLVRNLKESSETEIKFPIPKVTII